RLETVAEDEVAGALYAAVDMVERQRYLDLDLLIPPGALEGAATLGQPLPPGLRPWLTLRHVAGRQYPAAYCWMRTFQAACWDLPEAEGTGSWSLPASGAVV